MSDIKEISTAALAYLGDSVIELLVRQKLVKEGFSDSGNLNRESLKYVKAGLSGGDHIVNYDNILTLNALTEVLVSLNGVLAVNDYCIVSSLIEHAEVYTEKR